MDKRLKIPLRIPLAIPLRIRRLPRPTAKERRQEAANSLTHGICAFLAIVLLAPLILLAERKGNVRHVIGFSVFGSAMVFLFVASTLMHWHNMRGMARRVFVFLDYAGIFILIAGTYTPFCLVTLHGPLGWDLFFVIWGLALTGTLCSAYFGSRFDPYAIAVYLAMGWLVVVAIRPLAVGLTLPGLALLLGGGLAYTVGVVVLATNRFIQAHAVWHLFVGLGAFLHLLAMIFYVLPDLH
jgi:hemolysin III